jgi:hypothetical protein
MLKKNPIDEKPANNKYFFSFSLISALSVRKTKKTPNKEKATNIKNKKGLIRPLKGSIKKEVNIEANNTTCSINMGQINLAYFFCFSSKAIKLKIG